jgi:hypothetical protein
VIYPGSTPMGNATLVVANVLTCNKYSPIFLSSSACQYQAPQRSVPQGVTHPLYMYMRKARAIVTPGPPPRLRLQANAATNALINSEAVRRVALGCARLAGTGMRADPRKPPS